MQRAARPEKGAQRLVGAPGVEAQKLANALEIEGRLGCGSVFTLRRRADSLPLGRWAVKLFKSKTTSQDLRQPAQGDSTFWDPENSSALELPLSELLAHGRAEKAKEQPWGWVHRELLIFDHLREGAWPPEVPNHVIAHGEYHPALYALQLEWWGETLLALMQREGALPPCYALKYYGDILAGLAYLEKKGVVHGNIRPTNLLVHSHHVKLIDFAQAYVSSGGQPPQDQEKLARALLVGSYTPPETLLDGRPGEFLGDVWSAGCVYAELLGLGRVLPITTSMRELKEAAERARRSRGQTLLADFGRRFAAAHPGCPSSDMYLNPLRWAICPAPPRRPARILLKLARAGTSGVHGGPRYKVSVCSNPGGTDARVGKTFMLGITRPGIGRLYVCFHLKDAADMLRDPYWFIKKATAEASLYHHEPLPLREVHYHAHSAMRGYPETSFAKLRLFSLARPFGGRWVEVDPGEVAYAILCSRPALAAQFATCGLALKTRTPAGWRYSFESSSGEEAVFISRGSVFVEPVL